MSISAAALRELASASPAATHNTVRYPATKCFLDRLPYARIARFPAIEGETWNHSVLAGDILLVHNGEQVAAFRLATEGA